MGTDIAELEGETFGVAELLSYMHADTVANEVIFTGANVLIVNGSGDTDTANGLGNLLLGYDEDADGSEPRQGSHNLVIGKENGYEGVASIVHGSWSSTEDDYAAVLLGLDYEP